MTPGRQEALSFSLTWRAAKAKKQGDLYVRCGLLLIARYKLLPRVNLNVTSVSGHDELPRVLAGKGTPRIREFGIGWGIRSYLRAVVFALCLGVFQALPYLLSSSAPQKQTVG